MAPVFTHIVNLSIGTSVFPQVYKWAKVVPLLKSTTADTTLPKSYRPVALLPVLSKVLEKIVFSQLVKYLEDNHLVHPNLHGSRADHDTSTALVQLYDRWVQDIEEGKMVGVLFCDQSAAFDLCDHGLLLKKLMLMGVKDEALMWIKSYLSNRRQSCFVDGELSPPKNLMNCGVPQGSIGGPLLWLVFTCDQPDVIHEHCIDGNEVRRGCPELSAGNYGCGELVGYVDDGAYSVSHRNPLVLAQVLAHKFNLLVDWMNNNLLVINPEKTHLMVLGSKKDCRQSVSIMVGGCNIEASKTETLLGGQFHHSLKWNYHILESGSSLIRQLTNRNNGLKRVCRYASFKTKLMLANGAIHSKLVYLITLWGGAQQYLLEALQVQQLIAARTVCGRQSWRWSRSQLLKKVGWLSVRQLVEYYTILQAHKILTTGRPAILYDSLTSGQIHPYSTRSVANGNIRLPTNTSKRSFMNRAMLCYNRVPASIKVGTIGTVKKKLKTWIKENVPLDFR